MEVTLLTKNEHMTDMVNNAVTATLTCHANTGKDVDSKDLLSRIIKAGHESVLEHINLTYSVKDLSRACLQELARHRHISLSVESTRHTLKQQIMQGSIVLALPANMDKELKKIVYTYLQTLFDYVHNHPDMHNDQLKYAVPECLATNLVLTANISALRHIIKLRTAPAALKEFQQLARALFDAVPEEYRYLLKDCVYKETEHDKQEVKS